MKNFKIQLPKTVKQILNRLSESGFEAYIVGGCVRDCIMGKEPNDWDITTSALPSEVKTVFENERLIETGVSHGTVTLILNNSPYEITTYRVDGNYTDSRHPESVTFTRSLKEDLKRRDFTINAIAYNDVEGIVDLFDGARDIRLRTIRAVGDAATRFQEDALRILRALRFSSTLDFSIDEQTEKSAIECKDLLLNISAERILAELSKTLCGKNVKYVLKRFKDIVFTIIPELKLSDNFDQHTPYHAYDVYTHTVLALEKIEPKIHLRLATLLHDVAKPACHTSDENGVGHFKNHANVGSEMAEQILKRLKCDTATIKKVATLIKYHDIELSLNENLILKRLNKFGEEMLFDIIKLKKADNQAKTENVLYRVTELEEIENEVKRIIALKKCFSLKDLAVKGTDIVSLGAVGVEVGEVLNALLEKVIDGEIPNEKSVLLFEAKKLIKK